MKRLIAVLSVLILLCTLAGGGSLAQAKSVPQYDNYVALGDSITAGYPLPGFGWQDVHKAKWKLIPNSYAWRVSRAVRAKETSQMAKPGWRTVEMRTMLDKSYPGDTMMRETLPLEEGSTSQLDQKALKKLRHQYRLAIKNADPGSPDYVNDPHPTVKGHRQIANKVLAEL